MKVMAGITCALVVAIARTDCNAEIVLTIDRGSGSMNWVGIAEFSLVNEYRTSILYLRTPGWLVGQDPFLPLAAENTFLPSSVTGFPSQYFNINGSGHLVSVNPEVPILTLGLGSILGELYSTQSGGNTLSGTVSFGRDYLFQNQFISTTNSTVLNSLNELDGMPLHFFQVFAGTHPTEFLYSSQAAGRIQIVPSPASSLIMLMLGMSSLRRGRR